MARVDLDAAEYEARHHFHAAWVQPTVLALVAELRPAREVVEAARSQYGPRATLRMALEDYDEVVASIPPLTGPARRP